MEQRCRLRQPETLEVCEAVQEAQYEETDCECILRTYQTKFEEFYGSLKAHGSTDPFRARMFDFDALNRLIGTPEMLARGERYASAEPRPGRASERR